MEHCPRPLEDFSVVLYIRKSANGLIDPKGPENIIYPMMKYETF